MSYTDYEAVRKEIIKFNMSDYKMKSDDENRLRFRNGDLCPLGFFTWGCYWEYWKPTFGGEFNPEDCESFEDFKDKLMVAKL